MLPLSRSMVAVDIGAGWVVGAADVEVFSGAAFWATAAAAAKLDLEWEGSVLLLITAPPPPPPPAPPPPLPLPLESFGK